MLVDKVVYYLGTALFRTEDTKGQFQAFSIPSKRDYIKISDHIYIVDSVEYDLDSKTVFVFTSIQYDMLKR